MSINLCSVLGTRNSILMCSALLLAACASAPRTAEEQMVVAPAQTQTVWPAPPEPAVIRYVTEIKNLELPKKKKKFKEILGGTEDEDPKTFTRPFSVTTDSQGRVFVGDATLGALFVFGPDGRFQGEWGAEGIGNVQTPLALASDKDGNIYVCDTALSRVVVFGSDGQVRLTFGGNDVLKNPTGIAINEALGRAYVTDSRLHEIVVFSLDGEKLSTIKGPFSDEVGGLYFPTAITFGKDGTLWVLDSMNFRVMALDADGNHIGHWGKLGNNIGEFSRPKGIALDNEGHVYVSDAAFSNIQVFDQEGNLLLFFGGAHNGPGGFAMPAGLFFDDKDQLYVADQYNQRIQIFEFLGSPELPAE